MHDEIIQQLRCPVCQLALRNVAGGLFCSQGHTFDFAEHGYINLLNWSEEGLDNAREFLGICRAPK